MQSVVTPVSSNTVVEKIGYFNNIVRTKIGSPYVIATMNQLLLDGHNGVVGYEANGGFLQSGDICLQNRILKGLPTRDAVIPILAVLMLSVNSDKTISEYFNGQNNIKHIDTTDGVRITLENQDILHLRPSGNAPELRCYTETSSKKVAEELNKYSAFLIEKLG